LDVSPPFSICYGANMRVGRIGISVVKMQHFNSSLQPLRPTYLHCHPYCLIWTHIFCRIVPSSCKITFLYQGYSTVEEVYMTYKRGWKWVSGRQLDYALTSKWGRDCKELQSSRWAASLSRCSSYVRHTSTSVLIAWHQLTYFDALSSYCVK
jgi:hypothetical protein